MSDAETQLRTVTTDYVLTTRQLSEATSALGTMRSHLKHSCAATDAALVQVSALAQQQHTEASKLLKLKLLLRGLAEDDV